MPIHHRERHRSQRIGWLRAAVLGARAGLLARRASLRYVAAAHALAPT